MHNFKTDVLLVLLPAETKSIFTFNMKAGYVLISQLCCFLIIP